MKQSHGSHRRHGRLCRGRRPRRLCAGRPQARPLAIERDPADRGAGGSPRRAAAAADHALGDADRCRRALSGARPPHSRRRRGSRNFRAGRAHPAERAAGGLRADRFWPHSRQPGDVGVSAALSRGQRRTAPVGPHDQSGGRRRRSRGTDRPSRRFQPGRTQRRRHAADRGGIARLSQAARRAERSGSGRCRTIRFSSARPTGISSRTDARSACRARHASSPTAPMPRFCTPSKAAA